MREPARCELCNQYEPVDTIFLFRVRGRTLCATDDRGWELKAGIRHICRDCVLEVSKQAPQQLTE